MFTAAHCVTFLELMHRDVARGRPSTHDWVCRVPCDYSVMTSHVRLGALHSSAAINITMATDHGCVPPHSAPAEWPSRCGSSVQVWVWEVSLMDSLNGGLMVDNMCTHGRVLWMSPPPLPISMADWTLSWFLLAYAVWGIRPMIEDGWTRLIPYV